MMKIFIKNRNAQDIVVVVDENKNSKGLVFVMHGLGGFKEQPHIETFAEAFHEKEFTVVRFDTTNTFGESDGDYEDATVTNYYEDLEDVITWAKSQSWYREPFWLVGHSLGGISSSLFAAQHPKKIKALAPISTVVSRSLPSDKYTEAVLKEWKETGYLIRPSSSIPGLMKRLKWTYWEDAQKYDLLTDAEKLTMPTLLIVGENDTSTPPMHQQALFDVLPGKKELHIIKSAPHTFCERKHLDEIKNILNKWIEENL